MSKSKRRYALIADSGEVGITVRKGTFDTLEAAAAFVEQQELCEKWPFGFDAVATDRHDNNAQYVLIGYWTRI